MRLVEPSIQDVGRQLAGRGGGCGSSHACLSLVVAQDALPCCVCWFYCLGLFQTVVCLPHSCGLSGFVLSCPREYRV